MDKSASQKSTSLVAELEQIESKKRQLKYALDVVLPNLMRRSSIIPGQYQDEKTLIQAVFLQFTQNQANVQALESQNYPVDHEVTLLLVEYKAAMKLATEQIEKIRTHNHELNQAKAASIQPTILTHVKANNQVLLMRDMHQWDLVEGIAEHYNYALRVSAAYGADRCIAALTATRIPNVLGKGPKSGKIPLHHAIEAGQTVCVRQLLTTTSTHDYFIPAVQLLLGDKPNRPIDLIANIQDEPKKAKIRDIILEVLSDRYGQDVKPEDQYEIESTLRNLFEVNQGLRI